MRRRILIVEDDDDIGGSLRVLLEGEGYEVEVAKNGQLALDFLRRTQPAPDLILLDLMMPVMDGFQFLTEQEKDPGLTKVPVVVMTAAGQRTVDSVKVSAMKTLRKPLDIEDVLDAVARFSSGVP